MNFFEIELTHWSRPELVSNMPFLSNKGSQNGIKQASRKAEIGA
jgi:hypothetical protein